MPAARFKEDFENWIKSYESQGNKVYINNRIYRFNDDIILIMFSLRKHKNGELLVSTDENNKNQLREAIDASKKEKRKFFAALFMTKMKPQCILLCKTIF